MKTFVLFALIAIALTSCEEKDPIQPPTTVKMGDYYFKNGSFSDNRNQASEDNPIIGVVYYISDNRTGGKVLSFDEPTANWNEYDNAEGKLSWSSEYINIIDAESPNDGLANMLAISDYRTSDSTYIAYDWVHEKNKTEEPNYTSGTTGVWHLPAIEELAIIYNNRLFINSRLIRVYNATLIDSNTDEKAYYWSSTEHTTEEYASDNYRARLLDFSNGIISSGGKKDQNRVRAILAF